MNPMAELITYNVKAKQLEMSNTNGRDTCHTNIHETFDYPQTVEQYQQWPHTLVTKPNKLTFKDLHVSTNSD